MIVLTGWDEFKRLDFRAIFKAMAKPAFIFDGHNVLPHDTLREIGFHVSGIGKIIAEPEGSALPPASPGGLSVATPGSGPLAGATSPMGMASPGVSPGALGRGETFFGEPGLHALGGHKR